MIVCVYVCVCVSMLNFYHVTLTTIKQCVCVRVCVCGMCVIVFWCVVLCVGGGCGVVCMVE